SGRLLPERSLLLRGPCRMEASGGIDCVAQSWVADLLLLGLALRLRPGACHRRKFRSQVDGCRRCGNLQALAVLSVRSLWREGVRPGEYPLGMSAHLQSHPQTSIACLVECRPRAASR